MVPYTSVVGRLKRLKVKGRSRAFLAVLLARAQCASLCLLPQRAARLLCLELHEFACAAPVADRADRLSCIAVFANMSSSDSEDEEPTTAIDRELREAVYRGDLDAARRCLEGASTAGVFRFIRRVDDDDDDEDGGYNVETEETILTLALRGMRLPRHLSEQRQ